MTLLAIIILLFAGGIFAWLAERYLQRGGRWIVLLSLLLASLLLISYWPHLDTAQAAGSGPWWDSLQVNWIPRFGISFPPGHRWPQLPDACADTRHGRFRLNHDLERY